MELSSTSFEVIYDRFFKEVENDIDFFEYFNIPAEDAMDIARQRAKNLLVVSVDMLMMKCTPDVNFYDYNEETESFNFELTSAEIMLLSKIMFEQYIYRDIAKLKTKINLFTASEISALYSPANERNSFINMYKDLRKNVEMLISDYASKDRLTNRRKSIFDRK